MTSLDLLLVFRDARPSAGGLSIDVCDLANGLVERGHRVAVVTAAAPTLNGDEGSLLDGVEVVSLRSPFPAPLAVGYGLAPGVGRIVRRRSPIVHVFSCVPVYLHFAAIAAARRARRPIVWTPMMHPLRKGTWVDYGVVGQPMRLFDELAPKTARLVDAVAAATREEAEAFRRLGCARVEVIPPAVHSRPAVADVQAVEFRRRFGLADRPVVLLIAARGERRKGLDFGFKAFAALRESLPSAALVVAGAAGDDLEAAAGVIATGRLSDEDIRRAYRAADVVFVPSSYEAFSRVAIEAWVQERPVVVTTGVGVAETVHEGGGAVVAYGDATAAADALRELLLDREAASRQGRRGRALVEERFLVPDVVGRAEALYRELDDG